METSKEGKSGFSSWFGDRESRKVGEENSSLFTFLDGQKGRKNIQTTNAISIFVIFDGRIKCE
jgi:hypothetical protein